MRTFQELLAFLGESDNPGYHELAIPKGEVGELTKVLEEALEAMDCERQGAPLMALVELSDLIGAVSHYLEKHHPTISLADLERFSEITKRAFTSGRRS